MRKRIINYTYEINGRRQSRADCAIRELYGVRGLSLWVLVPQVVPATVSDTFDLIREEVKKEIGCPW